VGDKTVMKSYGITIMDIIIVEMRGSWGRIITCEKPSGSGHSWGSRIYRENQGDVKREASFGGDRWAQEVVWTSHTGGGGECGI